MTDVEKVYHEEISRGRGGARKINGSKSTKCTLPHENCTPAQLRKLCSTPLDSTKPTLWADFLRGSDAWQKNHLEYLISRFNATEKMIIEYFGKEHESEIIEKLLKFDIFPPTKIIPYKMKGWKQFRDFREDSSRKEAARIKRAAAKAAKMEAEMKPQTDNAEKIVPVNTDTAKNDNKPESNLTVHHNITLSGRKEDIVKWIMKQCSSATIKVTIEYDEK